MAVLTDIGKEFVRDGRMGIEQRGDQLLFYVKALAWTPIAIKRYRREIWNTLAVVVNLPQSAFTPSSYCVDL